MKLMISTSLGVCILTAAALAPPLASAQMVQTFNLNDVTGISSVIGNAFGSGAPSRAFRDIYNFSFADSTSNVDSGVFSFSSRSNVGVTFTGLSLRQGSQQLESGVAGGGLAVISSQLVPGSYSLWVEGTVASGGGSYGGNLSVSAVPEPETYAMMLVGLALVWRVARRRNRETIGTPPLGQPNLV